MKHIMFFLSTLLLLLFSSKGIENNTNLPVKKYKQNENLEKQLNINDSYLIPSKIKDYETIKDNIDDFEYYILENNCTYLIADLGAPNSSAYCEIKYISNCLNYNYFNEFSNELRYETAVLEIIGNLYLSGSTSLMLAENNGEMGANAVSSKNSFIANISSGVKNVVSRFTPSESSLFYIYANNASSFSNDITLVVYDAYGKVLSSAVTSQRNVSGLLLTLPLESGKEYYIYSYQTNNFSSPYKVSATGLKNLPYQGPSLSVTTSFTLFEANTNKLSFLIYRDEANIINFRFFSSLPDSVNIYKIDGF